MMIHPPISRKHLILEHYNKILPISVWDEISHLVDCSRNDFFEAIYHELLTLSQKKKLCNIDLLDVAFIYGDLELTQFIMILRNIHLDSNLLEKVILCDNLTAIKFLEEENLFLNPSLMVFAAEQGCLNCLKYCVELGFEPNKDTLDDAAIYGQLAIIQYCMNELDIMPDRHTLDCTILGSGLTPDENRAARKYIFDFLDKKIINITHRPIR